MSCSLFFSPSKGVTLRQGDTITVTWASGDVPNPPLVSDLNHINLTLENVLQSTNETLILGYAFKYGTENWKDTGLSGSCATQMSWNWTISSDLRLAESEYRLMLHNHTAVGPPYVYMGRSESFTIEAATTTSAPTAITTMTTTNPASTSATSATSTPTPASGLSTGAKAGIGVGAAAAVLLFGLGSWFFVRHRRRNNRHHVGKNQLQMSGYAKAEMDATETRQRMELDVDSATIWNGWHEAPTEPPRRGPVELSG